MCLFSAVFSSVLGNKYIQRYFETVGKFFFGYNVCGRNFSNVGVVIVLGNLNMEFQHISDSDYLSP